MGESTWKIILNELSHLFWANSLVWKNWANCPGGIVPGGTGFWANRPGAFFNILKFLQYKIFNYATTTTPFLAKKTHVATNLVFKFSDQLRHVLTRWAKRLQVCRASNFRNPNKTYEERSYYSRRYQQKSAIELWSKSLSLFCRYVSRNTLSMIQSTFHNFRRVPCPGVAGNS